MSEQENPETLRTQGVAALAGGGARAQFYLFKHVPPETLAATLRPLPGTVLVLQRDPRPGELAAFGAALGRPAHDLSGLNLDLERLLGVLEALDRYVSPSSTSIHVLAGLGKTADVLVPHPAEWRWMHRGDESPWFPGFRIWRESPARDWTDALAALGSALSPR